MTGASQCSYSTLVANSKQNFRINGARGRTFWSSTRFRKYLRRSQHEVVVASRRERRDCAAAKPPAAAAAEVGSLFHSAERESFVLGPPNCSSVSGSRTKTGGTTAGKVLHFEEGKLLSQLSSWGIGGPARYFAVASDEETLCHILRYANENRIQVLIVGKGSNCLFDDRGFDGLVISNKIRDLKEYPSGVFRAGGGIPIDALGRYTARRGWGGLEFASGIPGTVGGAVFMNAGANGQATADTLLSVEYLTKWGEKRILHRDSGELECGYRWSPFQDMPDLAAITAATFELHLNADAGARVRQLMERRVETQPVRERSAGCVFRNPSEQGAPSAGALIDRAGLKGLSCGGASVSHKHANFLVNRGGNHTSASEVLALIETVKEKILEDSGYELQEEIRQIPYQLPERDDR